MTGSTTNETQLILSALEGLREDVAQLRKDVRDDVKALHERIEGLNINTTEKLADKVDDNYCINKCRPNLVDKRFFGGFGAALIVITSAIAIIGRFWP